MTQVLLILEVWSWISEIVAHVIRADPSLSPGPWSLWGRAEMGLVLRISVSPDKWLISDPGLCFYSQRDGILAYIQWPWVHPHSQARDPEEGDFPLWFDLLGCLRTLAYYHETLCFKLDQGNLRVPNTSYPDGKWKIQTLENLVYLMPTVSLFVFQYSAPRKHRNSPRHLGGMKFSLERNLRGLVHLFSLQLRARPGIYHSEPQVLSGTVKSSVVRAPPGKHVGEKQPARNCRHRKVTAGVTLGWERRAASHPISPGHALWLQVLSFLFQNQLQTL